MGKDAFNWSKVKVKGIYNVTKCIEFLFIEESWICPQKIISSTYQLFSSLIIINFSWAPNKHIKYYLSCDWSDESWKYSFVITVNQLYLKMY